MSKKRTTKATPKSSTPHYCGLRQTQPRAFGPHVGPTRAAFIIDNQKKWVNGTNLKYWFFPGAESQKKAMRKAFKVWMNVGIGISFSETATRDDAQIRIAFANDGSWSYLGREILTIPKSEPTMNIGWDISVDIDTGVHEIGHTLGMPHEHQNPFSGIVWNEEAVYQSLAKPPNNWSRDKTYWNIIRKLSPSEVSGSKWDPDSIMHYPFEIGLIAAPPPYDETGISPAGGLSPLDIAWVKKFYPPLVAAAPTLKPFTTTDISAQSGDQANFTFKPDETRKYKIRTFGDTDAVLVLYEEKKGQQVYLLGTDDSGEDKNGELEARLTKGSTYTIRTRIMYRPPNSGCSIMVW